MSRPRDVSETLDALERKLRELEGELGAPAPAPPSAPAGGAAPAPPPPGGLDDLARQIDDLGRFREQLLRIGRELEDEYARVLARLDEPQPAPAAEPVADAPPPRAAEVPEPEPATGTLTVDAGPFADLDALAAFEQALGSIGGVEAVDLRGFEGRRAHLDVRLARPVALEAELRETLPVGVLRAISQPGRLVLDLEDGP
jgi:hypothetical protein